MARRAAWRQLCSPPPSPHRRTAAPPTPLHRPTAVQGADFSPAAKAAIEERVNSGMNLEQVRGPGCHESQGFQGFRVLH